MTNMYNIPFCYAKRTKKTDIQYPHIVLDIVLVIRAILLN